MVAHSQPVTQRQPQTDSGQLRHSQTPAQLQQLTQSQPQHPTESGRLTHSLTQSSRSVSSQEYASQMCNDHSNSCNYRQSNRSVICEDWVTVPGTQSRRRSESNSRSRAAFYS